MIILPLVRATSTIKLKESYFYVGDILCMDITQNWHVSSEIKKNVDAVTFLSDDTIKAKLLSRIFYEDTYDQLNAKWLLPQGLIGSGFLFT